MLPVRHNTNGAGSSAYGTDSDATLPSSLSFKCAVTDSKGPRRFMEDSHAILVPFAGIRGQGFFAIFDGHAGKHAAEWCGNNFSTCFLQAIHRDQYVNIPDAFNQTFHDVDAQLSKLSEDSEGKMHSGCTAVTAFLRLEDADGEQSFLPRDYDPVQIALGDIASEANAQEGEGDDGKEKVSGRARIINLFKSNNADHEHSSPRTTNAENVDEKDRAWTPPHGINVRRVLYCANVGDARGVLCRAGRAVRLTYDHKGSDRQEAKRIMDAGGFVMSGRVNGVLAVTRSLGDSSMKEYVVGAPYTTETELNEEDEFLILACDGLWDVVEDQKACELVRSVADPRKAAEELLDYAYKNYSTDNVTVLVVRFRNPPELTRADA